jgi:hypothetical protein
MKDWIIIPYGAWRDAKSVYPYQLIAEAYQGSGGFYTGEYLYEGVREHIDNRRKRMTKVTYDNWFRECVEGQIRWVGKKVDRKIVNPVTSELDTDSLFVGFLGNVDNAGTSMSEFMTEQVLPWASAQDVTFIVMDNFTQESMSDRREVNKANRIYPYIYRKTAETIPQDYTPLTYANQLIEIMFSTTPHRKESGDEEQRWIKWTTEYSVLMKKDTDSNYDNTIQHTSGSYVECDDRKYHNLGVVPVVPVYAERPKEHGSVLPCIPSKHFLAMKSVELLNLNSQLWFNAEEQSFSLPYYQAEDGTEPSMWDATHALKISLEATIPPSYASPDVGIAKNLQDFQQMRVTQFNSEAERRLGVRSSPSGVALHVLFNPEVATFLKFSRIGEEAEKAIARIFKLYTGEDFLYTVHYNKKMLPTNDNLDIESLVSLYNGMDLPPELRVEVVLAAMQKKVPARDEVQLEEWRTSTKKYIEDNWDKIVERDIKRASGQQQGIGTDMASD